MIGFQGSQSAGKFTVNLGIYVREVDQLFDDRWGRQRKSGIPGLDGVVKEEMCWLRTRLGRAGVQSQDVWWSYADPQASADDIRMRIQRDAESAFGEAWTRRGLIDWWDERSSRPPTWRIEPRTPLGFALLLKVAGRVDEARSIIDQTCREFQGKPFFGMVSVLAEEIGFDCPDLGSSSR